MPQDRRCVTVVLLASAPATGESFSADRPAIIAGAPVIVHAVRAVNRMPADQVLVCAPLTAQSDILVSALKDCDARVLQQESGNEGAVLPVLARALRELDPESGLVLVLPADMPLLRPETLLGLCDAAEGGISVLGPGGRTKRDGTPPGNVIGVCMTSARFRDSVATAAETPEGDSAALISELVSAAGGNVSRDSSLVCPPDEGNSVRTSEDLATAEAGYQARARAEMIAKGVIMRAPDSVWLSWDTVIEPAAVLEPCVSIGPGVRIEAGAIVRAFSHLEGCRIGPNADIGPFARVRPNTHVAGNARIGNFVELKAADVGTGAKISHLSYVGDAQIGPHANIGAGTITCNFDGVSKHRTVVGDAAFIGSNSALVAPVVIGAGAMTAAGSVVTHDVPDGALAVARARQENKPGLARRLLQALRPARRTEASGE